MIENKQEGHLRSYLREFAQGTTLHGVRYVGDNKRHWTERLCWMVAMSLCIAICSYQVFNVYTRWHVSPVIFTFAQRTTRVRDIPFPAVTVCPMLQIPRETLDLATLSRIVRTLNQPFWVTPETSAEAEKDETEDGHNVYNATTTSGRMNAACVWCCVLVHPPTSIPLNGHVDVLPWSDVDVKLYPEITTTDPALRSYSPGTRGCRFPEEHNKTIFKIYSRNNCKVECILQLTEQICKCREFFIPLDPGQPELEHCKTRLGSLICSDMQNLERPNCDDCLPSCNEIRYEKYVDRGQLVAQQLGREFDDRNAKAHPNLTKLGLFLTANCGGLLGLFTGCSVITLIEILYFATLRIFCTLRHRHRPLN
ncbi:hypothetical protein B566_EDAN002445 [Ephemera danica]|nr:hypothetical protein B566_EDAN002445 [Ephemera danica]